MKKLISLILIVFLAVSVVGCSQSQKASEENKTSNGAADPYKIYLIPQTMSNPFYITMAEGCEEAVAAFKEKGIDIELVVQAPQEETDAEAQLQILENAISAGADAILIVAISPEGIIPGIIKANEAGVKVINVDCAVNFEQLKEKGGEIITYIGSDNVHGAYLAGKAMGEYFKDVNEKVEVGLIEGVPGHANAEARKAGFLSGIAEYPNIECVISQTANFSIDQAYPVMQNMIQAHPNLKAVFACSDQMALGAIAAIKDAGKTGQISVFSFDATDVGLDAVREGTMVGTVAQYPAEMGYKGIEVAIESLTNPNAIFEEKTYTTVKFLTKEDL